MTERDTYTPKRSALQGSVFQNKTFDRYVECARTYKKKRNIKKKTQQSQTKIGCCLFDFLSWMVFILEFFDIIFVYQVTIKVLLSDPVVGGHGASIPSRDVPIASCNPDFLEAPSVKNSARIFNDDFS